MPTISWTLFFMFWGLLAAPLTAEELRPSALFSDHAVLPADVELPIWGEAAPGATVSASIAGVKGSTKTDEAGKWKIVLPALPPGGPHVLTISNGESTSIAKDVLIGDVWLAAGQSNMAMRVSSSDSAQAALAAAKDSGLRFFQVPRTPTATPSHHVKGKWIAVSPETVGSLSAVAYFFAASLRQELDRPIGIIQAAEGGSTGEVWTPYHAITNTPALSSYVKEWEAFLQKHPQLQRAPDKTIQDWIRSDRVFRRQSAAYRRGELAEKPKKKAPHFRKSLISGYYNGLIHPLAPYPIRGVLWYQGEANSQHPTRARAYRDLLKTLIASWRERWKQPNLPFVVVQLPEFKRGSGWWWLRDSQRRAVADTSDSALVVTIGHGDLDDIHPTDKEPVGRAAANTALRLTYEQPGSPMGPVALNLELVGDTVVVSFDEATDGLRPRNEGEELRGFEIAGSDGKFVPAKAKIEGSTLRLRSEAIASPQAVRYGFADHPKLVLVNQEGLPASPFYLEQTPSP